VPIYSSTEGSLHAGIGALQLQNLIRKCTQYPGYLLFEFHCSYFLVMLAINANSELSYSALLRVKTWLCSTQDKLYFLCATHDNQMLMTSVHCKFLSLEINTGGIFFIASCSSCGRYCRKMTICAVNVIYLLVTF